MPTQSVFLGCWACEFLEACRNEKCVVWWLRFFGEGGSLFFKIMSLMVDLTFFWYSLRGWLLRCSQKRPPGSWRCASWMYNGRDQMTMVPPGFDSVPNNFGGQGANEVFWWVNRCGSPHIFSSFPFMFSGQMVNFLGILTWDPSLIWNTA